ncbi:putative acetyltransferase [Bacillus sp. TS-2]|nr:putative acetyltransferase [Bacillus sp. TS-2]
MIIEQENKHIIQNETGKIMAEITFRPSGTQRILIEHTFVEESMRGRGLAKQLVLSVVERMRLEKKTIIPQCPYAKSVIAEQNS